VLSSDNNVWNEKQEIIELRESMKKEFQKRFFSRYMPGFKHEYGLERSMLLHPQYKKLDVIKNWMRLSELFTSNEQADTQFKRIR
jgi:hypothetical protein